MPEGYIKTNAKEIAALMRVNTQATSTALQGEAQQLKTDILADYQRTVRTWSHQVRFEALVDTQADGGFELIVGTDDKIYGYVDAGTRPHTIMPKVARFLRFQGGPYTAKTSPGVIGSTGGGPSGKFIFRQFVHHPGAKARNFIKTIFDKHQALSLRRIVRRLSEIWG